MAHAVIEQIQPGEVLMLTMPQPALVPLIGDLPVTQVKVRGAATILIDAAVRDVAELVELELPIWTRYVRVKGATKTEIGRLNVPVTVGGNSINPGDITEFGHQPKIIHQFNYLSIGGNKNVKIKSTFSS